MHDGNSGAVPRWRLSCPGSGAPLSLDCDLHVTYPSQNNFEVHLVTVARTESDAASSILVSLKAADLVMVTIFLGTVGVLGFVRPRGWEYACEVFLVLGLAPVALRLLAFHGGLRSLGLCADFFPAVAIIVSYDNLDPICDVFRRPLADAALQRIDQSIFGLQPSVALAPHVSPLAADVLMLCYSSFYLWPVLLGALLYAREGESAFDRWSLAVLVTIVLNYACYFAVPAIGPRFAQAADFAGPVEGRFVATRLWALFLHSPYQRDCFPSGHTAMTLLVLGHAYKHLRAFFWSVLPIGLGLIAATVVMRFHYGVDLLAAIPLALLGHALSGRLSRAAPQGIAVFST